jgi:hypothetical protein
VLYLNWHSQYGNETIDTAETRKEAEYLAGEYRLAYHGQGTITIARRPIKE